MESCHEPVIERAAPSCFTLNNIRGTKAKDCGGVASHEHLLLSEQEVWFAQGVGLIPRDGDGEVARRRSGRSKTDGTRERRKVLVDDACCGSSTDDEWPTVNFYKDAKRKSKRK